MKNTKSAFSLLEMLIVIGIIGIVGMGLYQILQVTTRTWTQGMTVLRQSEESNQTFVLLEKRLREADTVDDVALNTVTDGYIHFTTVDGVKKRVFLNTVDNQTLFGDNVYDNTVIIGQYLDGVDIEATEVLLDKVVTFNVTTYTEDASYFRLASANNVVLPLTLDTVSSIKLTIVRKDGENYYKTHRLIELEKTPLEAAGFIEYGSTYNGDDTFPFREFLSQDSFSTINITLVSDQGSDADGAFLTVPTQTVTIRNSGAYFSTIQNAIDVAVSGNEVLVAARDDGYEETLVLKSGVRLIGGYNKYSWARDLEKNRTVVSSPFGLSNQKLLMADNSHVDGISFDGASLPYGIYAQNTYVTIANCDVSNAEVAIYLENITGSFIGNEVTGNNQSMVVQSQTQTLPILRNKFYSKNQNLESAIEMNLSDNILFSNNLVEGGYSCISITGTSGNFSSVEMRNNLIRSADNMGISGINSNLSIYNNIIFDNGVGTHFSPLISVDIIYNLFVDNSAGSSTSEASLSGNTEKNNDTYIWGTNDPYFKNISDYELKDTAPDTIDLGNPAVTQNDRYVLDAPSKGGVRADIGAYGGPEAGRMGGADSIYVTTNDTFQDIVNLGYPGDSIIISSGNYTLSSPVSLKEEQSAYGAGVEEVTIKVTGTNAFNAEDTTVFESFHIDGNGSDGILADNVANISFKNLLITDASDALDIDGSTNVIAKNITFYNSTTGIKSTGGSSIDADYNIIYGASTGLSNSGGTMDANYNLFFSNGTDLSGSITNTNPVFLNPFFRDVADSNYLPSPNSNAIDIDGTKEAGSFEFYVNSGRFTSPLYESASQTAYKTLTMDFFGEDGDFPFTEGRYSEIKVSIETSGVLRFLSADGTITDNAVVLTPIIQNDEQSMTWSLPPTLISDNARFTVYLDSFRYYRSPYVNRLRFDW
ncbi:prepilin-type N-terminal cleavage/methylation domain-containing protein [bacterium]|jgi:prepilin-type N-terminal cleavage/methylation domain-containing protein|nr:prepilin-type N-terminal cleavage/methylation domain-containing protein [bacterium]